MRRSTAALLEPWIDPRRVSVGGVVIEADGVDLLRRGRPGGAEWSDGRLVAEVALSDLAASGG